MDSAVGVVLSFSCCMCLLSIGLFFTMVFMLDVLPRLLVASAWPRGLITTHEDFRPACPPVAQDLTIKGCAVGKRADMGLMGSAMHYL